MKFGSLFSGIGGFDLALENVGMECVWQCEIDKNCLNILNRRWPDVPKFTDIKELSRRIYDCELETEEGEVLCPRCNMEFGECKCVGTDQLIDEYGEVDLLCGGFPCTNISSAKDRWGAEGLDGEKSSLWFEYLRIIKELYPKWIIIENVGRLRNGEKEKISKLLWKNSTDLIMWGSGWYSTLPRLACQRDDPEPSSWLEKDKQLAVFQKHKGWRSVSYTTTLDSSYHKNVDNHSQRTMVLLDPHPLTTEC